MKISNPEVFAQAIIGESVQWIAYCNTCVQEFSEPVLNREDLKEVLAEHKCSE
jgi:hypothetical protein